MKISRGLKEGTRAALRPCTASGAEALGELTTPTPTAPRIPPQASDGESLLVQRHKRLSLRPLAVSAAPLSLHPSIVENIGLRLTRLLRPCPFISRFLAPDLLESMLFTTGLQSPGIPETRRLPLYSGFSKEDRVLVPCRFPSLNQVRRMGIWSDLFLSCDNPGPISTRTDCLECRGLRKYSK